MVNKLGEKYVINDKGKAVSVILDIKSYRKIMTELEELETIKAYDAAKGSCDEIIPFAQAISEIEK